jgi:hypothetical protein
MEKLKEIKKKIGGQNGLLLTGGEDEVKYLDDSGINFEIQSIAVDKMVKVSKSKIFGSWSVTCPDCGRESAIDVNDVKIALGEQLTKVWRYQQVGNACKRLDEQSDFISFLEERTKILHEQEDKLTDMSPSASGAIQLKCSFCGKTMSIGVTATATAKVHASITPLLSGELLSEQFKQEDLDFQVFENDTPETTKKLIELDRLVPLLTKNPLSFKKQQKLMYRLHWENDKSAAENAANFAKRIQSLQNDMEKATKIEAEAVKALESTLVDGFETAEAREVGLKIISSVRTSYGLTLRRKLRRSLLASLWWLADEIRRLSFKREAVLPAASAGEE